MKILKLNFIVLLSLAVHCLSAQSISTLGSPSFLTAVGVNAGDDNSTSGNVGKLNTFIGYNTGMSNQGGDYNIFLGSLAGANNVSGNRNVYLGLNAGRQNTGSGNVFIGSQAGNNDAVTTISNTLYIENSPNVTSPLIYGNFTTNQVGIGTSNVTGPGVNGEIYTLAVNGHMIAEEVTVVPYNGAWPDYVFAEDYDLMSLSTLESTIEELGHLPGLPSAEEVEENGHALGEMDAILLEKIEELTLHLIEINKEVKDLRTANQTLKSEIKTLKK